MITIDSEKCIGCFKCISVCPSRVLHTAEKKAEISVGKQCMKCLHCAAVCPQKAISLGDIDGVLPQEMPKFPVNFHNQIEDQLKTRRSYRCYKPVSVPKDVLISALNVSAWAPSAKNQHPAKWIVISDDNKINIIMEHILEYIKETGVSPEIAELYKLGQNVVMGNAKTLIIAYSRTNAINPPVDTALALYNVELMLQAQGIGTCWAGYLTRMCNQVPVIREVIKLPEDCQVYGALMVGYPEDEEYIHIPNRHKLPHIQWL